MGHAGELPADALDEGVLFVRKPQPHGLAQRLGHLTRASQQLADLGGVTGQQRLGEPNAAGVEFADGVEGLVALLRLKAVDAQPERGDVAVSQAQQFGVLLTCGQHGLVAAQVETDGVVGEADVVGVGEFVFDLGNGPVASETPVADEAEDIPADEPAGQGMRKFSGRAESMGTSRASGIGAVSETAEQFARAR